MKKQAYSWKMAQKRIESLGQSPPIVGRFPDEVPDPPVVTKTNEEASH